jgi:hypothetical protein
MGRKDRRPGGGDRLRALLQAGDHRAARVEARARLSDPAAPEAERAYAAAALASLAPERGALAAGALGALVAAVIAAWTVLAG